MNNRPCWIFYGTNDQNVKFVKNRVLPALGLEVKCWIGGLPDLESVVKSSFPKTTYFSQDASNELIDEPIEPCPGFVEMISSDFLLELDNLFRRFRLNYNYKTDFDEQNHCVNVARTYYSKIVKDRVALAIFFEYPHSIGSYIAYLVFRHLKIKVIIRTLAPLEERVFYSSNVSRGIPSHYTELHDDDRKVLEVIRQKADMDYARAQPSYMRTQSKRLFLVSKVRNFGTYLEQQRWKLTFRAMINRKPDLADGKFIYVGLHYQPELTSFPLGGIYNNQHLMILLLSSVIPDDWRIIIKEHPTTFNYVKRNMKMFRSEYYYKSLRNIPKVEFLDFTFDSFELIDKARCIATLTGTVGYEGVLRGKPCLVFGDAPYLGCEGIYRVSDIKSLKDAWDELTQKNFAVNKTGVIAYTERALANTLYNRTNVDFEKFDELRHLDYMLKVVNQ